MNTKLLTNELVTRDTSYSFFNFIGILPNPDKVLQRTGKTFDAFRELKNDPHVWSCIQSRKSGLLSCKWNLEQLRASEYQFDFIKEFLSNIDFHRFLRDISEAPLFGFQPIEIIWEHSGKFLVPAVLVAKPQEWFAFNPDGELLFKSKGNAKGIKPADYKILNVIYEGSYMNPYGQSLLSKCYWPVTFKNGGLRFWVNFMEKFGMPMIIGQYTRGATTEECQRLADMLAVMTEDTAIVSPSDIQISLHEPNRTTSVELYKELIHHCNAEISKAILSQTLTTELLSGSYAASMTHFRVRREVIRSDIRLAENAINTLLKYISEINFGTKISPQIHLEPEEELSEANIINK